jgi:tetratricopeptide (TPR) repeat protein
VIVFVIFLLRSAPKPVDIRQQDQPATLDAHPTLPRRPNVPPIEPKKTTSLATTNKVRADEGQLVKAATSVVSGPQSTGDVPPSEPSAATALLPLTTFLAAQCGQVNAAIASEGQTKYSRQDLLVMYGRSSAAAGQFDIAAAAYAMFVDEAGSSHDFYLQAMERLAECLAPLDRSSLGVLLTPKGPRVHPAYRMGFAATSNMLDQAVATYERLIEAAPDTLGQCKALLSLGWVHRAREDWSASTEAFDRCADKGGATKQAADALWLAAENLRWIGQAAKAAARLDRLIQQVPSDDRIVNARDLQETLLAETQRSLDWLGDPPASLQAEIAGRAPAKRPFEVHADAADWLKRHEAWTALVVIDRWACTQADWPMDARIGCHLDLIDALLRVPDAGTDAKREAADALARLIEFAPGDDWAAQAAIRRSRLLSECGEYALADATLDSSRWKNVVGWQPNLMMERIRTLLDRGEPEKASAIYRELISAYSEFEIPSDIAQRLGTRPQR